MAAPSNVQPTQQSKSPEFRKLISKRNFELAWRRLMTSPEPSYKWFWRPSASVANPVWRDLSKRLRKQIETDRFVPDHVGVLSEPKPSGLMRHKSVLSLGDLLVYQAFANVVAPKLCALVSHRYGKTVFGNNLARPDSPFFFTRWQEGYAAYNDAQRAAHASGKRWVAHFDFASYYDSIDHGMLEHLLVRELNVGSDVAYRLGQMLETWSSSGAGVSRRIERLYLHHGIPQGPQPSAMLAEVPFVVIDAEMEKLSHVQYLRYADDVRIYGEDRKAVAFAAAALDQLARQVGVFPAGAKCGIMELDDVEEILKKVSLPSDVEEPEDEDFAAVQEEIKDEKPAKVLWGQLRDLVEDGDTERLTLFKRLVATTAPSDAVALRLLDVLQTRPDLCEVVCSYLERLPAFCPEVQARAFAMLGSYPGYAYVDGRLLRVFAHHLRAERTLELAVQKRLWSWLNAAMRLKGMRTDCQLEGVARVLVVEIGGRPLQRLSSWLRSDGASPWAMIHFVLNVPEAVGRGWLQVELQGLLDHRRPEIARAAALRLVQMGVLQPNVPTIDAEAAAIFRAFRMDKPTGTGASRVGIILKDLLEREVPEHGNPHRVDWRRVLGDRHDDFEKYCVRFLMDLGTDKNGFILDLDAALEVLLGRLMLTRAYTYPKPNGTVAPVNTRKQLMRDSLDFRADFPYTQSLCRAANDLRNRCDRAHSQHTASGTAKANRSVYHHDLIKVLRLAGNSMAELGQRFPV